MGYLLNSVCLLKTGPENLILLISRTRLMEICCLCIISVKIFLILYSADPLVFGYLPSSVRDLALNYSAGQTELK